MNPLVTNGKETAQSDTETKTKHLAAVYVMKMVSLWVCRCLVQPLAFEKTFWKIMLFADKVTSLVWCYEKKLLLHETYDVLLDTWTRVSL